LFECGDILVDRGQDSVAVGNRERSAGKKVVLYVDKDQRVAFLEDYLAGLDAAHD
jgi:hypothetical protein